METRTVKIDKKTLSSFESIKDFTQYLGLKKKDLKTHSIMMRGKLVEKLFVSVCMNKTMLLDREDIYTGDLDAISSEVAEDINKLRIIDTKKVWPGSVKIVSLEL